jgi:hypothetical protein
LRLSCPTGAARRRSQPTHGRNGIISPYHRATRTNQAFYAPGATRDDPRAFLPVRIRKLALIPATILDKIVNMCQYQIKEKAVIFRDRRAFR